MPNILKGFRMKGSKVIGPVIAVIAANDPYFNYTTLLLPGSGSNGANNNVFVDASTNNFAITRNGNATQGTFSPFSQTGWSNYFDGTGDYLETPSDAAFGFGTGDYTIEGWVYSIPSGKIMRLLQFTGNGDNFELNSNGTSYTLGGVSYYNGTTVFGNGSAGLVQYAWNHIVLQRTSGTVRVYVNALSVISTGTTPNTSARTLYIGGLSSDATFSLFSGYLASFRIVKGSAVYSGTSTTVPNFTLPTAPLTAISGTSLLTCQSNRFIDNSANAFTITPNGDVSVQAFSPFAPAAAWSAATYGGSGYFDGTGDYLVTSTNAAFAMSSGDFTVEAWVNVRSTTGYRYIFDFRDGSGAATNIYAYLNSGTMNLNVGVGTTDDSASGSITLGAWAHVALVRSGSTITVYINGVSTNSFSSSQNFSTSTAVTIGRRYTIEQYFIGYISNLHIVKGTAVYTANFTPPTSPVTAISNTSLLLNFTNAGIYDATGKNNLETVGNAQISTTTAKFGSSSIYSNGAYLRSSASNLYNFGSGDFTVEMYIYLNSFSSFLGTFCGVWGTTTPYREWIIRQGNTPSPSKLRFVTSNGSTTTTFETSSSVLVTNQWMHIAACRASGTLRLYVDGIEVLSGADSNNIPITGTPLTVFSISDGTVTSDGYLQDLRITKGYARYTANFTPATAVFPVL